MSKTNILIVEDESIVAKDIAQSLKKLGYNVLDIVNSGEAAVLVADEKKPDLVLMDIMLKGEMSGIDAANFIHEKNNIPVIFLTAYADESTLGKVKISEPYGYIIKPFKEIDLHSNIEMALYKHQKAAELKKERDFLFSLVESQETSPDMLFIKSNSKLVKVQTKDVFYVEALKDYVIVNTLNARYTIHSTMKEIESKLPSREFVRVHRSYIVRLDKIISIEQPYLIIEHEKKPIPIGGSHKEELMNRLNLL